MGYTENKKADIIVAMRQEVNERAEELSYAKSREIFRTQLEAICAEYGCQFLGFNLVRMLHKEYGAPVQGRDDLISINGITFARDDVVKPSAISVDDKDKYAGILANITCSTGLFPMSEDLAVSRFCVLLKENLYLEDDLQTKRDVSREDILNIARGLEFSFQETNELLFRTLECGVLTDTSAADLIERFIIENNQNIVEREKMLAEYKERTRNITKKEVDKRKENITQKVYDKFVEDILSADIELSYEKRKVNCLNYLIKNARFLDAPNRTAMHMYRKLLCYIRDAVNEALADEYIEQDVFSRLDAILIKNENNSTLSEETCVDLVRSLLDCENSDNMESAYAYWSVPTISHEGELVKEVIGTRMEKILCGSKDVIIQKKDIIFALFLACSLDWEYDETIKLDVLKLRLARFENLTNAVLSKIHLEHDKFYLPHPLEASVAIAIMCGPWAEGMFRDILANLEYWRNVIMTNSTSAKKKLPHSVKEGSTKPPMDKRKSQIYIRVQNACCNGMQGLIKDSEYSYAEQIYALEYLANTFSVPFPNRIEVMTILNISDNEALGHMIVLQDGNPYRSQYRILRDKSITLQNAAVTIEKFIKYRFEQYFTKNVDFAKTPDLLIVEGDSCTVKSVSALLAQMGLRIPVFGVFPDLLSKDNAYEFVCDDGQKVIVENEHPMSDLLKTIQEETHRYTLCYQSWIIAREIRKIWQDQKFNSIDVYFEEDGYWGYLPATSIGVQYVRVGRTPKMVHDILYGQQQIDIPFVSKVLTGKKKICTIKEVVDVLLPDLDIIRERYLYRKAVIYLILGQIQDARSSFIYHNENRQAGNLVDLECEAHVKGHRIMKLKGFDMVTQTVRDT